MKKLLLSIVALLCVAMSASAGDVVFKTLTFPAEKQDSVNGYSEAWTATNEGLTWKLAYFNNFNNGWDHIRCGHKKTDYVATVTSPQISEKITRFIVNFTKINNDYVKAAYLEVASDEDFSKDVQKVNFTLAVGDVEIAVPSLVANSYYRLTIDCGNSNNTSNGYIQLKSIKLYKFDETAVSAPSFTPSKGVYYEAIDVTIANADGNDIYYSFDDASYSKYTAPVKVAESKTIYAYAQKGDVKSDKVEASYKIAKNYASLDDLLKETPTAEGWPVIVPIVDEEIASFYLANGSYKNGVFLVRQANGKNFELYKSDVPTTWKEGDKLNGTAKGIYQVYNEQWEISLNDEGWSNLSNGSADAPKAPVISFDSDTKAVTITEPSGENTIYYTIDGTEPDDSKTLYEGPFTISQTTTVKAVCYNDDDVKSAVTTLNCVITEELVNIAALNAACTATSSDTAPEVTFTLNNIKVTGVNGQNIFIQDATGSFLLFDKSKTAKFHRGDVLSGSVKGKLYSYNNLPELAISDSWANTTSAAGDAPQPTKVNAADITKADASRFVRFEGLEYVSTDGKNITLKDATGNVVLRNQFDNLGSITFSTDCKYNMNTFVIPFKDDIQYYVVDPADIEVLSDKKDPQTTFTYPEYAISIDQGTFEFEMYAITSSDGAKSYASSNEAVATIDDNGVATLKRTGVTTISLSTASTATYMESTASAKLKVMTGNEGTLQAPLSAGDVYAYFNDGDTVKNVWVKAYIVGYADGAMSADKVKFSTEGETVSATNFVISDVQNESNYLMCTPVELPKGAVRTALNLKDNPSNLGKEVWLKGNIIKYFSQAGLKGVSEYTFDATVINHINAEDRIANDAIYNLAGQRISAPVKGQIVIIGGKKMIY